MILVTGGTGVLGSFIVPALQKRGQALRLLVRPGSLEQARALGVDVSPGDLSDGESLRKAMHGVSGVVHAACTMSQEQIDIAAMRALVERWEAGPFVYISSVDVYGYPEWLPVTEAHPLQPESGYAMGKVTCERLLQEAAARMGRRDHSILRPPHIWGPHPKALQWIAARRVFLGQPVVLPEPTLADEPPYGDDWIDARELAWAAAECLERPLGQAANAINSHFTWHDFFTELIRLSGSRSTLEHRPLHQISPEELPNPSFYAQTWQYSGGLLQQQLGFRPSHRLQDTLAEIVACST